MKRKALNYKSITKAFEQRITALKTPPKRDMRFAKTSDFNELARNSESAWQLFLLWRELCSDHLNSDDENRLMMLATMGEESE